MHQPDFKAEYESFYALKASPLVAEFNANRSKYRNTVIAQKIFLGLIFYALLFVVLLQITHFFPSMKDSLESILCVAGLMLFVVLTLGFVLIRYLSPNQTDFSSVDAEKKLKEKLMPELMRIFGDFKWHKTDYKLAYRFNDLRQTKIIPQNLTVVGDDAMAGNYNGVGVKISEMHVGKQSFLMMLVLAVFILPLISLGFGLLCIPFVILLIACQSAVLLGIFLCLFILALCVFALWFLYKLVKYFWTFGSFRGVMIELDMPKSFSGHTFAYEMAFSAQPLRNASHKGYDLIKLEDVDFSKRYTVYSTNQTEARYVLTPAFMERLKNISLAYKAKYIRFSFQNNKLILLAASDKDLFMMADAFHDTGKETFDILFDEIVTVLGLVDELKLQKRI